MIRYCGCSVRLQMIVKVSGSRLSIHKCESQYVTADDKSFVMEDGTRNSKLNFSMLKSQISRPLNLAALKQAFITRPAKLHHSPSKTQLLDAFLCNSRNRTDANQPKAMFRTFLIFPIHQQLRISLRQKEPY